jgi:two-component system heavy metal sensor histidine kinase CusS
MSHHEHFMHSFKTALWLVVGLAALVSGFLGWMAARRGLAPLREISRSAAGITASRLDQRLAVESIPVELAEVAQTLNEMLARLEASFRRLSDFSSDLAHELRTPVSNLLTQTQVTLARPRTLAEYQDVLASNAEEFERLSRTIADMLFLAKSDNALIVAHRERVDLAAEIASVSEFYEALVEEKGISLSCSGSGVVLGDRLMLRRAVGNLLSNAVRHTPEKGRVAVHVVEEGSAGLVVTVENTGESIAPEHLPRLFDRFYRVDPSRQRFGEGAGLGLAIVRSIVRAHGGEVAVRSDKGSTVFEIRFST